MQIDKAELFALSADEKRNLAFDLLDSIDEEMKHTNLPEWKKELILQRVDADDQHPETAVSWDVLRNKYKR